MEGVAVAVGETGKRHAAQDLLTGAWFHADPHLREAPSSTSKRRRLGNHQAATRTPPSTSSLLRSGEVSQHSRQSVTPARQSSGSAHSAGE